MKIMHKQEAEKLLNKLGEERLGYVCKNCKKRIFVIISRTQVEHSLKQLNPKIIKDKIVFECPLCKRPNRVPKKEFVYYLRREIKRANLLTIKHQPEKGLIIV